MNAILNFQRKENIIDTRFRTNLDNPHSMTENFILERDESESYSFLEVSIFNNLFQRRWSLNELSFFCESHNLCLSILNANTLEIVNQVGSCSNIKRGSFSYDWSYDFEVERE